MIILIKIFSPDGRAGGTGRDATGGGRAPRGNIKKKHFFIEKPIFWTKYSWGVTFFRVFACVFWFFEKQTLITVNNGLNFQKELEKMYDLNYSKCCFTCISFFKNWNLRYETYTPRGLISYFDQTRIYVFYYLLLYFNI